ncbi:MAG: HAD family phosphatase [bacterium]
MFQALLFDMDGVIINSQPTYYEVEKQMFKDLGVVISEEEHHALWGMSSYGFWEHVRNIFGLSQTVDELREWSREQYQKYFDEHEFPQLVPGFLDFVSQVHGKLELAIASSASPHTIQKVVDTFGLKKYFHSTTSAHEVSFGKPHPDVFLRAAEKVGVKPKDCVVIEDTANGVLAAKTGDMACIGFQNPGSGRQDLSKADRVVRGYGEISVSFLQNLYEQIV